MISASLNFIWITGYDDYKSICCRDTSTCWGGDKESYPIVKSFCYAVKHGHLRFGDMKQASLDMF